MVFLVAFSFQPTEKAHSKKDTLEEGSSAISLGRPRLEVSMDPSTKSSDAQDEKSDHQLGCVVFGFYPCWVGLQGNERGDRTILKGTPLRQTQVWEKEEGTA